MAYEIGIAQVGPAEYPLIGVLRDTIYREFGHQSSASVEEILAGRQDVLALMAHLEGNPIGYKVGYRFGPHTYFSWTGGVLREYRGMGLARLMQEQQHAYARSLGYRDVLFSSFNRFRAMLCFGLASGFAPIGASRQGPGDLSIQFSRELAAPTPPRRAHGSHLGAKVESVSPNYHGAVAQVLGRAGRGVSEGDVDALVRRPGGLALLAFLDHAPVGALVASTVEDLSLRPITLIHHVGVEESQRNKGVARALLAHLASGAIGGRIVLRVDHLDRPAMLLGLSAGFNFVGVSHDDAAHRTMFTMELRPAPASNTPPLIRPTA